MRSAGLQEVYLKAPKGARWYNAYVDGFLEGGAEGAFHGWKAEGEDLGDAVPHLGGSLGFLIQGQYYE